MGRIPTGRPTGRPLEHRSAAELERLKPAVLADLALGHTLQGVAAVHGVAVRHVMAWRDAALPAPNPVLGTWAARTAERADAHLVATWAALDNLAERLKDPGVSALDATMYADAHAKLMISHGKLLVYRGRMEGAELAIKEGGDA